MSADFRLETRSLVLRPFTLADSRRVFEMSQEECARRWLPSQIYRDEQHAATAIAHMRVQFDLKASPTRNAYVLGAEERLTGRLVGHVCLCPLFDAVEVGFGIATSEQRKGFATEGVARVCAWGLEWFSLPAILGVTDEENVASQRVLIRCGFHFKEQKRMLLQGVDRPVRIFELGSQNSTRPAAGSTKMAGGLALGSDRTSTPGLGCQNRQI